MTTPLPTAPQRTDSQVIFDSRANAFIAALPTFQTEMDALGAQVTIDAATATTKASEASASASAAALVAGATLWVSGQTYTLYDAAISPSDFLTYRRIVAGAGTTDPASDPTNWTCLNVSYTPPASMTASARIFSLQNFGGF